MNESQPYTASLRWVSQSPYSDETGSVGVPEDLLAILIAHVQPAEGIGVSYYEIDIHEGDMCALYRADVSESEMEEEDYDDDSDTAELTFYPREFISLCDALRFAEHHAQNGDWGDAEAEGQSK